jgi:hypothetical protein
MLEDLNSSLLAPGENFEEKKEKKVCWRDI